MANSKIEKDVEKLHSDNRYWLILFASITLYSVYMSKVLASPAKAKLLAIIVYVLTLPISVLFSVVLFTLDSLHEFLYHDKSIETVSKFIADNHPKYESIELVRLIEKYSSAELLNFKQSEVILLKGKDNIKLLEVVYDFRIEIFGRGFLLNSISVKEAFKHQIKDFKVTRDLYHGIKTAKIIQGSDETILAFTDGWPGFVEEKVNEELNNIKRSEIDERTDLDLWNAKELDDLAKSLDDYIDDIDPYSSKFYFYECKKGQPKFLLIDKKYLISLDIDVTNKEVSEANFHYLLDKEQISSYNNIAYLNRQSNDLKLKICFADKDIKEEFEEDLKRQLNEEDIYFYEGYWDTLDNIRQIKEADLGLKDNFRSYTPYEFEDFIRTLFEEKGYDAKVTKQSSDYGIDVIAENNDEKLAIQVKRYKESNKVGSPSVQKTLGSKHKIGADKTILVTTSWFTDNAKTSSDGAPIELWNKSKLRQEVKKAFF